MKTEARDFSFYCFITLSNGSSLCLLILGTFYQSLYPTPPTALNFYSSNQFNYFYCF